MRRLLAGVLVAGVAGLCAGCGSGDDTSSNAAVTSTPTSVTTVEPSTTTTTAPTTTLTEPADPATTASTATTTTTPTTPALPAHVAYIAKADAVCAAGNAEVKKLNEQANKAIRGADNDADRLKAIAPILKSGLQIQGAQLKRFKAVTPPAADRTTIATYWGTLDRQAALLAQLADAAAAGDVAKYQQLSGRSNTLRTLSRGIAKNFGFKECGSGSSDAA